VLDRGGEVLADRYRPFGAEDHEELLDEIRRLRPHALLLSLVGQDAVQFNRAFGDCGLSRDVLRLSCAIEENGLLAFMTVGGISPEVLMGQGFASSRATDRCPARSTASESSRSRSATGRGPSSSSLAVSSGCVTACPPAELEGVLAHELAHIKHHDVALQTAVVVLAASMIELSRIGGWLERALLFVLGPMAAACIHILLSPKREFEADYRAAEFCGSPHGLADALIRLEQAAELIDFKASPATEPLWTFNPFLEEGLAALFVTHPPIEERVRRLRRLDPDWRDKLRTEAA